MAPVCYLNGEILPESEARVGVRDIGLLRGYGIYEALAMIGGVPFALEAHMSRLRRSTAALRLALPVSDEEIRGILAKLYERNGLFGKDAVVRFIITGGQTIGSIEFDPSKPTFYILVEELQPLPQEVYRRGCSLIVHEHQRMFPEYKTTNYITAVILQASLREAGALEILYTYRGKVLECATSNFFIVKDGAIVTPEADVLAGITRGVVIELAHKEFPLEERDLSVEEMYRADEAFITSSFKHVVPVATVGGRSIGGGKPGPVTKRVMALFHAATHAARE